MTKDGPVLPVGEYQTVLHGQLVTVKVYPYMPKYESWGARPSDTGGVRLDRFGD